jgi:membrane-bound lytic murein transglycosylase D
MTKHFLRAFGRRKIETATIGTVASLFSFGLVGAAPNGMVATAASAVPTTRYVTEAVQGTATPAATNAKAEPAKGPAKASHGLPVLDHARVDSWIKRFTTTQRNSFATYLKRMTRYEGMISEKLADRGLPQGLIYLAMIESGFDPSARSQVAATGLWQFMSATAREYGLRVGRGVDERKNPARATDAALDYLADLYDRFGSWYLAAAAYNTGQGRVARVMKQVTGRQKGTDADYYRIASRLPRETRDYVPKMIAAASIGSNPQRYGFAAN